MIELNLKPTRSQLRSFALLWFPLMCCMLAYVSWHRFGFQDAAKGILAFGALTAVVGGVAPYAIRWLFVGLMVVTFPIGLVISSVVLVLLYFGVITPIGLTLRALGKDPLSKRPDRSQTTYWRKRPDVIEAKKYFRQF